MQNYSKNANSKNLSTFFAFFPFSRFYLQSTQKQNLTDILLKDKDIGKTNIYSKNIQKIAHTYGG